MVYDLCCYTFLQLLYFYIFGYSHPENLHNIVFLIAFPCKYILACLLPALYHYVFSMSKETLKLGKYYF